MAELLLWRRRSLLKLGASCAVLGASQVFASGAVAQAAPSHIVTIQIAPNDKYSFTAQEIVFSVFGGTDYVVYGFTEPGNGRLRCTNYAQKHLAFEYTPKASWQGTDEFALFVRLPSVADVELVIRLNVAAQEAVPGAVRVKNVASYRELLAAIGAARPGDHIVLEDGTYAGGTVRVAVKASKKHPLVIRAKNRLKAKLVARLELVGDYAVIQELDLDGKGVAIGGEHNHVTRCRLFGDVGNACDFIGGTHGRLDFCDVTVSPPRKLGDIKCGCNWSSDGQKGAHLHATVAWNWFHDFPAKLDTSNYHSAFTRPIRLGEDQNSASVSFHALIEYNLIERIAPGYPEGSLELKASDCIVRFNTFIDSPQARLQQRQGFRNRWEGNWIENCDGFNVLGWDHTIVGNRLVGTALRIMTGDDAGRISLYPAATNILCAGNRGALIIGADNRRVSASKIRVEDHVGSLKIARAKEVNEDLVKKASLVAFTAARKLKRTEVGPHAMVSG